MQVAELSAGSGDHLGGGVGFMVHRPAGSWCGRARVLVSRTAQIAQHLGLAVMRVEHRMGEDGALALERASGIADGAGSNRHRRANTGCGSNRKQHGVNVGVGVRLVESNTHCGPISKWRRFSIPLRAVVTVAACASC